MKAKLVTVDAHEGAIAMIHGMGFRVDRLVFEDGLVVTLHNDEIYVFMADEGLQQKAAESSREVEVPDDMTQYAANVHEGREVLHRLYTEFVPTPPERRVYLDEQGTAVLLYPDEAATRGYEPMNWSDPPDAESPE